MSWKALPKQFPSKVYDTSPSLLDSMLPNEMRRAGTMRWTRRSVRTLSVGGGLCAGESETAGERGVVHIAGEPV